MIVIWKKNGLRLRILTETIGRFGETRFQVQKETAEGMHGIFSLKAEDFEWVK